LTAVHSSLAEAIVAIIPHKGQLSGRIDPFDSSCHRITLAARFAE
jgi:hypothetical protein